MSGKGTLLYTDGEDEKEHTISTGEATLSGILRHSDVTYTQVGDRVGITYFVCVTEISVTSSLTSTFQPIQQSESCIGAHS